MAWTISKTLSSSSLSSEDAKPSVVSTLLLSSHSLCRTFDASHHARIPFDKGCRSSWPIIQTSRRGREDRFKGISKAGVARFPFPLRVFRSSASQRGRSSSFRGSRTSREQYSIELVVTKNSCTEIICFKFVRSKWICKS